MVRDEQMRASGVGSDGSDHAKIPEGIDSDRQPSGPAQQSADACATGVPAECGEPIATEKRCPRDDDQNIRGPEEIGEREGDDSPLENSSARPRQRYTSST
jgi:hypothetical protein